MLSFKWPHLFLFTPLLSRKLLHASIYFFSFLHISLYICSSWVSAVARFSSPFSSSAPHLHPYKLWACLSHDCHLCWQLPVPGLLPFFLPLPVPKLRPWDPCLHLLSGRTRETYTDTLHLFSEEDEFMPTRISSLSYCLNKSMFQLSACVTVTCNILNLQCLILAC